MTDPFADLVRALADNTEASNADSTAVIRVDPRRRERTGAPEIVLAERKSTGDVLRGLLALIDAEGIVIATRLTDRHLQELPAMLPERLNADVDTDARTIVVTDGHQPAEPTFAPIGVISAGTSDRPVAQEAIVVARALGSEVIPVFDVGVAGLHRLVQPLRALMARRPAAIIVAAGMDGALPSVVAGLVNCPVIGLPVAVGYGHGANGEAALATMLQSCAPGLSVVNINNGVGAAVSAHLIARQRNA